MRVSFDPAYDDHAVLDAVAALRAGDRRPAAALLRETGDDWDRKAHRVGRPAHDEDCHRTIAEWVAAEPGSADAHMVNARALVVQGWAIRGSAYARYVREAPGPTSSIGFTRPTPPCPPPWHARRRTQRRGGSRSCWPADCRSPGPSSNDAGTGSSSATRRTSPGTITRCSTCAPSGAAPTPRCSASPSVPAGAPPGSPLHALSLFAVIEYAMALTDGREEGETEALFWKGFQAAQAVDRAVDLWEKPAAEKGTPPHARAVFDRMHLAFCASRIGSGAIAARQFRAMGPYCSDMPWSSFVILPRFRTRVCLPPWPSIGVPERLPVPGMPCPG